ncbi:hypothetical protein SCLARK_001870 [Spiroplasma clarkii]|uniref:Folate family ECF transporter S component n=1 Tax=Spiroplasma clarkii TaxID=2139 RepID=A0A1Y0L2Q1_9MOLU|nr:folate family ECF transporter S component [Spiroplasma clarkii]ARU92304.1 hypothetical protein SCLARK_001870 [Spiroplasma clarkii]ATX71614.1 hypothetical protein SCLAR_v1c13160 [Spiroplasma clarkii]
MIYLITNIVAAILIVCVFVIALAMEDFTFKKITIRHITVISLFAAVSVILTNLISYSIPIFGNIRLALGDWIIFLLGMIFGPLCGVISAISIDAMGNFIPNAFGFHAGYMLNKVILGFFGALVFFSNSKNRVFLKILVLYALPFTFQSLLFNQIWMMSYVGNAAWLDLIVKLIKLPIALPIYVTLTYSAYKAVLPLLKMWPEEMVWCLTTKRKNHFQDVQSI